MRAMGPRPLLLAKRDAQRLGTWGGDLHPATAFAEILDAQRDGATRRYGQRKSTLGIRNNELAWRPGRIHAGARAGSAIGS